MTLLFFSDIPWSALHQRPQHLASRFARKWRVIWIEPATLGTKVYWTPVESADNLFRLSVPQFPHNARSRIIRIASRLLSRLSPFRRILTSIQRFLLMRAFRRLGAPATEMVAFVQNFQFIPLIKRIPSRRVVFDYIDDAFGFTDFPPYIRGEWTEAVVRADAITTTSALLREQMLQQGRNDAQVLHNGVDSGFFAAGAQSVQRPEDLPAEEQIVVYTGSVYPWFDFDLLGYMVRMLPQYQFVLIGHEHPGVRMDLQRLQNHANFHVLGVRPYESLPSYLAHACAGIIPFKKNTLTAAVNPVKLYEYCAAGLPTVTTDFATELADLGVPLFISSSREQFVRHLREAIARSTDAAFTAQLRAFARSNDWEQRAQAFTALIDPMG